MAKFDDVENQDEQKLVQEGELIPHCSDGWHKDGCGRSYYVHKSHMVVSGVFSAYALNGIFSACALNGAFSLLAVNAIFCILSLNGCFSILSMNSAFSILSMNSFFAIGCDRESFKVCF